MCLSCCSAMTGIVLLAMTGCEIHHDANPELIREVVRLSRDLTIAQSQLSSLQQMTALLFILCLGALVVAGVLGIGIFLLSTARRRHLPLVQLMEDPRSARFVIIDRATGAVAQTEWQSLPAPARQRLLQGPAGYHHRPGG